MDRYGPLPAPVQSLLQLMEIKLLPAAAKRCGLLETMAHQDLRRRARKTQALRFAGHFSGKTPMEEPSSFRRLRQGLAMTTQPWRRFDAAGGMAVHKAFGVLQQAGSGTLSAGLTSVLPRCSPAALGVGCPTSNSTSSSLGWRRWRPRSCLMQTGFQPQVSVSQGQTTG